MSNQKGKPLLTNREREVFELLVQDKTTKEIAQQLFISEKTVRNHISNVMHTLCKEINEPQPRLGLVNCTGHKIVRRAAMLKHRFNMKHTHQRDFSTHSAFKTLKCS